MMKMQPAMRLADDISAQFRHYPIREAAEVIADHIRTFWDPRMRAQLIDQVEQAGMRCDPNVAAAVHLLTEKKP